MKKLLIPVLALIMGAGVVMASNASQLTVKAAETMGKITVNGMGAVNVKPDIAYINIGYTNQNEDSKTAQTQNNAQMEKIIAAVKSLGIADKDIQTIQFNIYPQTDYNNGNKITGYSVTNMIRVTVRKMDQAGGVMDKAVGAGANAGGDIQFAIADPSPYYEQAMDLAIKNAASKAGAIAKSIGVTIGKPSEINEMNSYYTPVLYGNANTKNAAVAGDGMSVQTGDLSVSANIQVVYGY